MAKKNQPGDAEAIHHGKRHLRSAHQTQHNGDGHFPDLQIQTGFGSFGL
jgi:hypothetical protein